MNRRNLKKKQDPVALREAGLEALAEALGPVGMVRFLQQFDGGRGDYTKERRKRLPKMTVKEIARAVRERRNAK